VKQRDHFRDLDVDGKIILMLRNRLLMSEMDLSGAGCGRAFVNMAMNLRGLL
jgi:hypothetical protein